MALQQVIDEVMTLSQQFDEFDFDQLISSAQQRSFTRWHNQNIDLDDLKNTVESISETFALIRSHDFSKEDFPFNTWNGLKSYLNNSLNYSRQFMAAPDQRKLDQVFAQTQALQHCFHTYGIIQYLRLGPQLPELTSKAENLIDILEENQGKFIELEKNVKKLATEGASSSLAQAFATRQSELEKQSKFWFRMTLASIAVVALLFGLFENFILSADNPPTKEELVSEEGPAQSAPGHGRTPQSLTSAKDIDSFSFTINMWLLRIFGLGPAFYFFIFSLSQYKKERALVEEYAHRKAVAKSLPVYKELMGDPAAKDNISQNATSVIFSLPSITVSDGNMKKQVNHLKDIAELVHKVNGSN